MSIKVSWDSKPSTTTTKTTKRESVLYGLFLAAAFMLALWVGSESEEFIEIMIMSAKILGAGACIGAAGFVGYLLFLVAGEFILNSFVFIIGAVVIIGTACGLFAVLGPVGVIIVLLVLILLK